MVPETGASVNQVKYIPSVDGFRWYGRTQNSADATDGIAARRIAMSNGLRMSIVSNDCRRGRKVTGLTMQARDGTRLHSWSRGTKLVTGRRCSGAIPSAQMLSPSRATGLLHAGRRRHGTGADGLRGALSKGARTAAPGIVHAIGSGASASATINASPTPGRPATMPAPQAAKKKVIFGAVSRRAAARTKAFTNGLQQQTEVVAAACITYKV